MLQDRPLYRNQLLRSMNAEELAVLEPHLENVLLNVRDTLEPPDTPITHVYFVEEGVCSVVAKMRGGRDVEVGIVGREGATGTAIVQGDYRSPHVTFVQMRGSANRIGADQLRSAFMQRPAMHQLMHLYARAFSIQVAATALANGRSKIEERLARWLLMLHDRMDGDRINLTHEFLSVMLGVRRPGVTVALHVLEGKGLIQSNRAEIIMIDREGLIAFADGAYGVPEKEYQRLMTRAKELSGGLHLVR
jgi:CRP-like cAMP-binding protein